MAGTPFREDGQAAAGNLQHGRFPIQPQAKKSSAGLPARYCDSAGHMPAHHSFSSTWLGRTLSAIWMGGCRSIFCLERISDFRTSVFGVSAEQLDSLWAIRYPASLENLSCLLCSRTTHAVNSPHLSQPGSHSCAISA